MGTVSIWTHESVPEFWLECDGRAVDTVKYPEFRKLMSFLPDYRDRFLQGKGSVSNVNDRIEAGLPNITGTFGEVLHIELNSGAFFHNYVFGGGRTYAHNGFWETGSMVFDASLSNPIYGKSTTVQPPAVVVKYIIKAK